MTDRIIRPESPELDREQLDDLKGHFEKMSVEKLKKALDQTIQDVSSDTGNQYKNGGVPANVNHTVAILQELIDGKTSIK